MKSKVLFANARLIFLPILMAGVFSNSCIAQVTANAKGYGKASYNVSQAGKFMTNWLIAGPFSIGDAAHPDEATQQKSFKADVLSSVQVVKGKPIAAVLYNEKKLDWKNLSWSDDIIDLDSIYQHKDFAYAYALAEINAAAPATVMFAVGSDDGIKVWHNGKLVHDNWTPRGVDKDEDVFALHLVKGSNQLLLKIQDMEGGWAFVARMLDKVALANQLTIAASNGIAEKINFLTEAGADINAPNESGITPLMAAKISGRDGIVDLLLKKGAKDGTTPPGEAIIDGFYQSLNSKESPGIAVLVARDGNILYEKGFGYADVGNKIKVTPETKFRIGSVTKQFTAAAILKLQENKLLSIDDKLSKFIPDFPRGDEVTIFHLLTHTSGIHSYTSKDNFIENVTKTISPDSLVSLIKKDPFDFDPGQRMLYNNSGYFLLGYIISKVSGKPYDVFLQENFFTPLKMTNTGVHHAGIKLEHEAKGYSKTGSKFEEAINWDMSWAGGAGAIYSTLEDLLKWNVALHGGKVLQPESLKAALTPTVLKNGAEPSMKYGFGLGLGTYRGMDIVSHSGGLNGFLTQLSYYPKEKLTVVMFTNTSSPEINFNPDRIAESFLWEKMEKQSTYTEIAINPEVLKQYTGRFELLNVGVLTITTEETHIYAQLSGQSRFEIFPMGPDEFFLKVVDARVKFQKDASGVVNGVALYQNGQELKGKKLAEEKIITLDSTVMNQYLGKYRLSEKIVVTIYKEKNKLIAWPTDQPKLEMLPVSETDFVIKEINAKLSFVKDEKGVVKKIKLNMNGMDSELPKLE